MEKRENVMRLGIEIPGRGLGVEHFWMEGGGGDARILNVYFVNKYCSFIQKPAFIYLYFSAVR